MRSSKRLQLEACTVRLRELCSSRGIGLQQYSDIHFRLFGKVIVDYWPSTGRIWATGTDEHSTKGTVTDAVDRAGMVSDERAKIVAEDLAKCTMPLLT